MILCNKIHAFLARYKYNLVDTMLNVIGLVSVPSQWHLQWTGKLL